MRIKRPTVGRGERQRALPSPLPSTLFLYLFRLSSFSSPFPGKVNLFIQSQQGVSDTPTQLRSLSTHPCQGELSPRSLTHTHTHTSARMHTHTFSHSFCSLVCLCWLRGSRVHARAQRRATSPLRRARTPPLLCSKGQSSSVGGSS